MCRYCVSQLTGIPNVDRLVARNLRRFPNAVSALSIHQSIPDAIKEVPSADSRIATPEYSDPSGIKFGIKEQRGHGNRPHRWFHYNRRLDLKVNDPIDRGTPNKIFACRVTTDTELMPNSGRDGISAVFRAKVFVPVPTVSSSIVVVRHDCGRPTVQFFALV